MKSEEKYQNEIFDKNMTSIQARFVLHSKCEDKCIGEKERIFEEYKAVLPAIIKRETEEGMCGVLD